jgi:alpha-mannosidase
LDVTGLARTTGEPYGLSLLNDGKYSFDVLEKEIHLTVLRSPIYAHHDPLEPEEDGEYSFIDQGIQRFTYSLLPHQGQWQDARTVQTAAELNQKAIAVIETYHAGPLPQADSFLTVSDEGVMVSVVKRSEDGDAMIIRCVETSGSPKTATIALPRWNREFDASFGPCEIKTFRIEKDESVPVKETNLLEFVDGEIE